MTSKRMLAYSRCCGEHTSTKVGCEQVFLFCQWSIVCVKPFCTSDGLQLLLGWDRQKSLSQCYALSQSLLRFYEYVEWLHKAYKGRFRRFGRQSSTHLGIFTQSFVGVQAVANK
eukprot:6181260-Pleurochrysis_carterae.AAC.1